MRTHLLGLKLPLLVSLSSILITLTPTDYNDELEMDSLVVKRIHLLESSTPDDVFELRKESVESLDAGRFPLFRKSFIFGKCKVGLANPEPPIYL